MTKTAFLLRATFLLSLVFISGCRHVVQEDRQTEIAPGPSYSPQPAATATSSPSLWWQVFNDDLLNGYIQRSLNSNFTLQQGYARLKQARFFQKQADSHFYPSVDGRVNADSTWQDSTTDESTYIGVGLIWEWDLWGRLSSAASAATFETQAVEDELQAMGLLLSNEVADTYYQLVEQSLYLDLLQKQIKSNETSLDLIKLRFGNGAASLVDVYQQQELVAAVRTELPLAEARSVVLYNKLYVLTGRIPDSSPLKLGNELPEIPSLPQLGIPAELLINRPDLRQYQRQLVAADYRVAEAVADRLPTLRIGISAGSASGDFLFSIFADALAVIFDGGYKKSEVEKRKAVVEENLAAYSQRFLIAIEEVENSLHQERQHDLLLVALDEQLRLAKATLRESRNRYMQGMTDYLPVLAALVSIQKLERTILQRQRERLSYRLLLYKALGGNVLMHETHSLNSPATEK